MPRALIYGQTHSLVRASVSAFGIHMLGYDRQRRMVDHSYDSHGHVGAHNVSVRHAQEQHERHEMPLAQTAWNK